MDALPIAIFWALAAWATCSRRPALLYLFFASMPFGSFAVVPTTVTGGLTLTPTPMVAVLLIARQLLNRQGLNYLANMALLPSGLLVLTLFWAAAIFATLFMPRLFAGAVNVVPMKITAFMQIARLQPTTQNISQLVYVSISVLAVFAFARMLRQRAMRMHVMYALFLGGALAVFTGLLDQASQYVQIQPLLAPFRTASYSLMTEVEILGGKRVVGLMPEASAFGAVTLIFLVSLYFFRRAMPPGTLRDRAVPVLLALLLAMTWLSTSSAAYLGLGLFGLVAALEWASRALLAGSNPYLRRGLLQELGIAAAGICLLVVAIAFNPAMFEPFMGMVDTMVFKKTGSSSFEERSMWTQVSWQALLDTYGMGVGMGGTRASNFAVTLASNVGFVGAVLYCLFVLQSLLLRRVPADDAQAGALKRAIFWSFLTPFVTSLLIGTSADFGLSNAFLFGLGLAITQSDPARAPVAAPPTLATPARKAWMPASAREMPDGG